MQLDIEDLEADDEVVIDVAQEAVRAVSCTLSKSVCSSTSPSTGRRIVFVNAFLCALQLHLPFRADDLPSPYPLPSRATVFLLALLPTAPRRPTRLHAKISHLPALPISLSNFSSLSPLFCLLSVHCRTRTGVLQNVPRCVRVAFSEGGVTPAR